MKSPIIGTLFAYLLIPIAVGIAAAGFMLSMVQSSYFPDTSGVRIALMIGAGLAVAAIPMSLSLGRLGIGPLSGWRRVVAGVIGGACVIWLGVALLFADPKYLAVFPLIGAILMLYLAAEDALLRRA